VRLDGVARRLPPQHGPAFQQRVNSPGIVRWAFLHANPVVHAGKVPGRGVTAQETGGQLRVECAGLAHMKQLVVTDGGHPDDRTPGLQLARFSKLSLQPSLFSNMDGIPTRHQQPNV